MKNIIVLFVVFSFAVCSFADSRFMILTTSLHPWTNELPANVSVLDSSNIGMVRVYNFQKYMKPTNFPAMVQIDNTKQIVYGFATAEEGESLLARQALAMSPEVNLRAIETPYIVLNNGTNAAIGIAATTPDGDLITWQEHASPWDINKASSNRLAAVAARVQLRADLRALKSSMTNNIADAQNIGTNATTATIKDLRRELIDAQQDAKELRRIVSQLLKQGD